MDTRPLTERERAVLDTLLATNFDGAAELRRQAADVQVTGGCGCGCPSIDFRAGRGMIVRVDAVVHGGHDSLFLYTFADPEHGELLGGIEYAAVGDERRTELPPPDRLTITPARR
ncbi:hypothetical protein FHR83_006182 [Actinoplanes campanulatus]|uniref:Uncharacterized protein n=1 Tax=Actinoplanes campanulatus TaxID=113559 RepID=A0A7W5FHA5_9ACTN|nr:hypothetical protein [Actinoplanes campanulatus]MBB3098483.1 hypothetical protein [Actinoplanes campanulatus]GGN35479.1 hypothetical protein GCM10010109_59540 [Actinoplanes campanulatus]GID39177.1 hypothetical protein Aca09nite_56830 [Actinoplanes campanulatus]